MPLSLVNPTEAERSDQQAFVIPTGAQRSGGTCSRLQRRRALRPFTPQPSNSGHQHGAA